MKRFLVLAASMAVVGLFALPTSPAHGASYVVDTTDNDPGVTKTACTGAADDCSLRGAISNANLGGTPGDVVTFDATVFNPGTINLASQLSGFSGGGDTIDGTGADVTIQGDEARLFTCFVINSAGNTIKGLRVTDCVDAIRLTGSADSNTIGPDNVVFDSGTGISLLFGATDNTIIGNKVGTDAAGTAVHPDGGNSTGVQVIGADNTVGGTSAAHRNIVSANGMGILLTAATGNTVIGNFVGTDVAGLVDLGNGVGLTVANTSSNNTIGGAAPSEANLISGNTSSNVDVISSASNNSVAGNIIGPDISGSGVSMASGIGVRMLSATNNNTIGPRNVISDSGGAGVQISGAGTTGNVVKGNFIGTNLTGTAGVPNSSHGVSMVTSASGNAIGGTGSAEGNVIAFNGGRGVEVNGADLPSAVNNAIRGNSIYSNSGLEIDNVSGGNTELLPPILASTLFGTVSGFACPNCQVDIFSDNSTDARFYQGSVTTASDGGFTFVKGAPFVGASVTATNTDGAGNTSELSVVFPIDSDGDGTVDGDDGDDDNDSSLDADDGCRVYPEDYDGFQDGDGCPEPDNDLDGVCDSGHTSPSCSGSDFGRYAWVLPLPATQDCRNVPEDFDSFHDTDGCPEPDNDNDGHPDGNDDCPATDYTAGTDGVADTGDEPLNQLSVPIQTKEDYDNVLDYDGCHDSPGDDYDGDSFSDEMEALQLGTNPARACPLTVTAGDEEPDPWPLDFDDNQVVNVLDVFRLLPPSFGSGAGDPNYSTRKDLVPNGVINILDVFKLLPPAFGSSCAPAP